MQKPRPRPARITLAALAAVTALVASGCGGGDVTAAKDGDSPDAQKTRNGIVLRATWPLTGLDAHDAAPTHPPLVVKIDNTSPRARRSGSARPTWSPRSWSRAA